MMLPPLTGCLFLVLFLFPPSSSSSRSRQLELEDKHSTLELELRKCMEIKGACWCELTSVCCRLKIKQRTLTLSLVRARVSTLLACVSIWPLHDTEFVPCVQTLDWKCRSGNVSQRAQDRLKMVRVSKSVYVQVCLSTAALRVADLRS